MTRDDVDVIARVIREAMGEQQRTIEALQAEVSELRRLVIAAESPPRWAPGSVHRQGAVVEHHLGQRYRAKVDTAAEPGADAAHWERIGTGGFRLAGPWTEGRTYADGDLFVRDYGTFLWANGQAELMAGRGAKGEPGLRGAPGDAVTGFAVRGSRLVLSLRNADGTMRTLEADLVPALEALAEATRESDGLAVSRRNGAHAAAPPFATAPKPGTFRSHTRDGGHSALRPARQPGDLRRGFPKGIRHDRRCNLAGAHARRTIY